MDDIKPPPHETKTSDLIKWLGEVPLFDHEAIAALEPGQRVRVAYATSLRQIAYAMKHDTVRGIDVWESMDCELGKTIDDMFRPYIMEVRREADFDFRMASREIDTLRAENARLTAEYAELKASYHNRVLEGQALEGEYRELEAKVERLEAIEAADRERIGTMQAALELASDELKAAAAQFRDYEKQHMAKSPPDVIKAGTNGGWALRCELSSSAALAAKGGENGTPS